MPNPPSPGSRKQVLHIQAPPDDPVVEALRKAGHPVVAGHVGTADFHGDQGFYGVLLEPITEEDEDGQVP